MWVTAACIVDCRDHVGCWTLKTSSHDAPTMNAETITMFYYWEKKLNWETSSFVFFGFFWTINFVCGLQQKHAYGINIWSTVMHLFGIVRPRVWDSSGWKHKNKHHKYIFYFVGDTWSSRICWIRRSVHVTRIHEFSHSTIRIRGFFKRYALHKFMFYLLTYLLKVILEVSFQFARRRDDYWAGAYRHMDTITRITTVVSDYSVEQRSTYY